MSGFVVLEAAASLAAAWALAGMALGAGRHSTCEHLLRLAVALLLGLGILSATYAVALFSHLDQRIEPIIALVIAALSIALAHWLRSPVLGSRLGNPSRCPSPVFPSPRSVQVLRILFLTSILVAAISTIEHTLREPEGGFDAWAIWNSRARFLFRSTSPALEAFSPALGHAQFRTHADYPLLVPGLIVEGFRLVGRESIVVPAVVAIVFGVLLASLVTLGIAELLGGHWGLLAGTILLSAPIFVTLVVRQCADVPLAAFVFTASLIAVRATRTAGIPETAERLGKRKLAMIGLAGLTLSFAAWCKNEGVVFLIVLPLTFLLRWGAERIEWRERLMEAMAWAAGALPVVVLLAIFKLHFTPRNDLLAASGWAIISPLFNPVRWWLVAVAVVKRIIALQEWGPHLLATIVVAVVLVLQPVILSRRNREGGGAGGGGEGRRRTPSIVASGSIAVALMLAAFSFAAVYLLTPHDVVWQVRYTFDRLVFQCWPTALLAIFLVLATPDGHGKTKNQKPETRRSTDLVSLS